MPIRYEVDDRVARISFDRPEKHNAFRDEDLAALVSALQQFDVDEDVDAAILFGQGPSFSSGGDVSDRIQRAVQSEDGSGRTTETEAFVQCENWKPIIAAVHGYCLGHALGTALLCDLIVAAEDARFQVTEIKLGLPMVGFLPRLGHAPFATEVALTGRMFTAREAWDAGMLTRLVGQGEHLSAAEDLARMIIANPKTAVRETVRVRRLTSAASVSQYRDLQRPFDWASSADARDGVAGLLNSIRGK